MRMEKNLRLSSILIRWYNEHKRDLPWRDTTDPYTIWLSEIILQQTRVNQGYSYFNKFIGKYPTVDMLAKAEEEEVLKLWQGLGYYSRARNLHTAAKTIMENFDGIFPKTYKEILSLKGVGEYTAAAIVSFAYDQPYAVVDGNVYRVLSRIFAIDEAIDSTQGKKTFAALASAMLDDSSPGIHNQAIMEFGALQCVPVSPDCSVCPAAAMCLAYAQNKVNVYPVKEGKQKIRNRYFTYLDIRCGGYMLMHKRTAKDIWQNLYEPVLIETEKELSIEDPEFSNAIEKLFPDQELEIKYMMSVKHVLSHQIIYATFYRIDALHINPEKNYLKIKTADIDSLPVSQLVHKYLEKL